MQPSMHYYEAVCILKKAFAYLYNVSRDPAKYFFTILFFFAVAFCRAKKACPDQAAQTANTVTFAYQEQQVPNGHLERLYQPAAAGGQIAVLKNLFFSDLLAITSFYQRDNAEESSIIKASSLLIKDYLFHIYPSHNFW